MTKLPVIAVFLILLVASCKVAEKNIPGTYRLERLPKTAISLKADKTFQFEKNNPNPYLHPFDHPDEYYFITKGTWTLIDRKTISLQAKATR